MSEISFEAALPDFIQHAQKQMQADLNESFNFSAKSVAPAGEMDLNFKIMMQEMDRMFGNEPGWTRKRERDREVLAADNPRAMMIAQPQMSLPTLMFGQTPNLEKPKSMEPTSEVGPIGRVSSATAERSIAQPVQNPRAIADDDYYNAKSLTPQGIDAILRQKNSPFAQQVFSGGRTAGQVIYDAAQNCGTLPTGPRQLNPAMLLSIMGAETSFGQHGKWSKTNPFSIRLNGSFDNVKNFEDSVKIAANTMYNWAQRRPVDSTQSLFDYAGSRYCENYETDWKPNVEAHYRQFVHGESIDEASLKPVQPTT